MSLVGGLALAKVVIALVTLRYRRGRQADLGTASHQWVAELRFEGTRDRNGG